MLKVQTLHDHLVEYAGSVSSTMKHGGWWRKPLLATGKADDRFGKLKDSVFPDHFLPEDLVPGAQTVITFFLPFKESLVKENREGELACWNWGLAYGETNSLIAELSAGLIKLIKEYGHVSAVAPITDNFDKVERLSPWSQKHLAQLTGLGKFGVHTQIITPSGAAGRLGSLVTDARLGDNPLTLSEEMCLNLAGRDCLACVRRCPPKVLSETSLDRQGCYRQCLESGRNIASLSNTDVCGKCVAVVPCSFRNPLMESREI